MRAATGDDAATDYYGQAMEGTDDRPPLTTHPLHSPLVVRVRPPSSLSSGCGDVAASWNCYHLRDDCTTWTTPRPVAACVAADLVPCRKCTLATAWTPWRDVVLERHVAALCTAALCADPLSVTHLRAVRELARDGRLLPRHLIPLWASGFIYDGTLSDPLPQSPWRTFQADGDASVCGMVSLALTERLHVRGPRERATCERASVLVTTEADGDVVMRVLAVA